jgi:lipoprotein signal peptidase
MLKLLSITLLISLDQLSKYFIIRERLFYSCNPYISWSIPLSGVWLWIFIILALSVLFYSAKQISFPWSTLFIFAGAIGNIIDRLKFDCVTDFISLNHIPLLDKIPLVANFPTFNLADTFITIGTVWLLFKLLTTN